MLTNEQVIEFLRLNRALTLKALEEEASLGQGILNKVVKGNYRLNASHLERLLPVLKKYGFKEPDSSCRVISFVNQKGGVAKTTSAANFGAALWKLGKRVLMVDFDPQTNLSGCFGLHANDENIYKAMKNESAPPIINIKEGMDIIPADIELAQGELEFYHTDYNFKLSNILKRLKPLYDYIVIDTGPSLGALMINALIASDRVLIPIQPEKFATRGLDMLLGTINRISQNTNPNLRVQGVFFTLVDKRLAMHEHYIGVISEEYSHLNVYKTLITSNTNLKEAQHEEVDIFEYAPKSAGAMNYLNLAKEVVGMVDKKEKEVNHG